MGIARHRRRLALPHVSENETEIFAARIALDPDLIRKGTGLGRLIHALSQAIIFPAVIDAADSLTVDNAGRELGAAMGASVSDQVHLAAAATEQSQILAKNPDGLAPFR